MRRLLSNEYFILALRLLIGTVFLVASADKVGNPAAFATSIGNYKLVSHEVAMVAATVLPWMELLCAFGLLFGVAVRGSSLVGAVLLVVFTGAVISGVLRGLDISCGCFTQDPSVHKIGWWKVAENSLMFIGSILLVYSHSARFTLENYIRRTQWVQ
jgi:uncharacterized membrane protein YphA (DoxX/SURF4 family)